MLRWTRSVHLSMRISALWNYPSRDVVCAMRLLGPKFLLLFLPRGGQGWSERRRKLDSLEPLLRAPSTMHIIHSFIKHLFAGHSVM